MLAAVDQGLESDTTTLIPAGDMARGGGLLGERPILLQQFSVREAEETEE